MALGGPLTAALLTGLADSLRQTPMALRGYPSRIPLGRPVPRCRRVRSGSVGDILRIPLENRGIDALFSLTFGVFLKPLDDVGGGEGCEGNTQVGGDDA